ncbi:MAG: ComEC/Rec2 family competence protein [Pyrinomonadaceae bacterium]
MPVLWVALSFALGIALAGSLPPMPLPLLAACVLFAVLAIAVWRTRFAFVLILLAFGLAGSFARQAEVAAVAPDRIKELFAQGRLRSGESVEFTGRITGAIDRASQGLIFSVNADSIMIQGQPQNASGTLRLFANVETEGSAARYAELALEPGNRITAIAELDRDERFRNPGVRSRVQLMDVQGIDATGTISSPVLIRRIERTRTNPLTAWIFGIRDSLILKFRQTLSTRAAGIAIASMFGNKHFLDAGTAGVFRDGGTFHILVISGLHITFLGGIAAAFVGLFTRRRLVRFFLVCGFLWIYAFAVGAESPVIRASLMFTILWFAYLINRPGSLLNALGLCGLLLLAWRPGELFSPSFQLTFVSVGAIVLAGFPIVRRLREIGSWTPTRETPFPPVVSAPIKRFCESLYWNEKAWQIESSRNSWSAKLFKSPALFPGASGLARRLAARIFEGLVVSAVVQFAMLPLTVHYFHRFVPVSVVLNIWTGPLVALLAFVSSAAAGFSIISSALSLPLVRLADLIVWLILSVPGQVNDFPGLSFRVPVYAAAEPWIYFAYLAAAAILGMSVYRWDPFDIKSNRAAPGPPLFRPAITTAAFAILTGAAIVLHPFSGPRGDGRLYVEFLDVGQGDSTLITFPNGETMLVDAGGRRRFETDIPVEFEPDRPSIGEMVVSEFLWEKGISSIDRIVATHADADHIEGLTAVISNFRIGEAWFGPTVGIDDLRSRLEGELSAKGVPIKSVSRGDTFEIAGVRVDVLHPNGMPSLTAKENDLSVVIRLTFGGRSFLLTGDIESAAELELVNGGAGLGADVIKVPHHGSRSSSTPEFVGLVRPRFAVIPVGRRSHFGHPHEEVVKSWSDIGASVITTGDQGTAAFSTDGRELVVYFPVGWSAPVSR